MRLMDLFKNCEGNLSICGVMIGDKLDEQRDKLIKDGIISGDWNETKGTVLTGPRTGIRTRYLNEATIFLEGQIINRIVFEAEFKSYPNDVADSFLGIVKEMEKYGIAIVKPQWKIADDMITNQYKVHNILWDTEVNERISDRGTTNITLELSANQIDSKGEITENAVGVYMSFNELVRRNAQLEEYVHNPRKNTIFF